MPALIVHDDVQLRRIDRAISGIAGRPPAEQRKLSCLLAALQVERSEILGASGRRVRNRVEVADAA